MEQQTGADEVSALRQSALPTKKDECAVTKRAVLLGILGCLLISFGEPMGVGVVHGSPLAADYSTGWAVFLFFILCVINWAFSRKGSRWRLAPGELVVIYAMTVVACALPSWGFVMNLIAMLAGSRYFADPSNKWNELLIPNIAPHLPLRDYDAARFFYEGLPSGRGIPWGAWTDPLLWWFVFALVMFGTQLCLMVVLRRQWVQHERLVFPLTQLPQAMAEAVGGESRGGFFTTPWMWCGFALPFLFHSARALHTYYPLVPLIRLGTSITMPRWSGYLSIMLLFEVVGLSYLLSTDVALSMWFFPLVGTAQVSMFRIMGWNVEPPDIYSDPGTPPVAAQGLGAMTALVVISLWRSRGHLRQIIVGRGGDTPSARILAWERICLGLASAGTVLSAAWLAAAGIPPIAVVAFLLFTLIIFLGLARVVCQAGLAYGRPPVTPVAATWHVLGRRWIDKRGLVGLGLQYSWAGDVRTMVLASAANGLKLGTELRVTSRALSIAMASALPVTLCATAFAFLRLAYTHRALSMGGWHVNGLSQANLGWVMNAINQPSGVQWHRIGYALVGAATYSLLSFVYERVLWWPLHPAGLTLGLAGPFAWVWFSVFLAWLAKVLVLRYGGATFYERTRPFFLGLVLGSFTTAGLWLMIDALTGMRGNVFTLG